MAESKEKDSSCFFREDVDKPMLLRLPYAIRRRIYTLAGLILPSAVHITLYSSHIPGSPTAWSARDQKFKDIPGNHPVTIPNQLFYVSRAISNEAIKVFYSENIVGLDDYRGLLTLQRLSPLALRSLSSLRISVLPRRCPSFPATISEEDLCTRQHSCKLVDKNGFHVNENALCEVLVAQEWERCCTVLASHVQPGRLKISLELPVSTLALGPTIVHQISRLPTLKQCSATLTYTRDRKLQRLLEATILRVTGQVKSCTFPFNDLPAELQLKVLSHTDLSAPGSLTRINKRQFVLVPCLEMVCLGVLKNKSCHLRGVGNTYMHESNSFKQWINTLNFINKRMNVRSLVLSLHLEFSEEWTVGFLEHTPHLDEEEEKPINSKLDIPGTYRRIVESVARLKGLKDLFVHIGMEWDEEEAFLERMVMGPII
ncbi:predicted protein [Uncinocarpus reesii 1704]|uniref:F-box domain-containing protein n=1 Tax=Uncinocarpus reesii (strain UAMH 1704) TaxID=336963 RepID=C4JQ89_UNCRE|nr:uncharacterized protein UREG_04643 [Uncinocarpus reesii 1704]EEP79797.1 predicted protein [Uncinocarpus reesii 1704]